MKILKHLWLVLLAVVALACGPAEEGVEDPSSGIEQAQSQSCFIIANDLWETPIIGAPGFALFYVKAMNIGTASCSYRISRDIYESGSLVYSTPVGGPWTLAPYSGSGPTKTTSQVGPTVGNCTYDVWFKYKNTPSSPETWHRDVNGPFWC